MVRADGSVARLEGKAAALLGLAALGSAITRREAAGLLWPETSEAQSRSNLRTLMSRISKSLGIEAISMAGEMDRLGVGVLVEYPQVNEILESIESGGAEACVLLAGVDLPSLEEFRRWLEGARDRFRRQLAEQLSVACDRAQAAGETVRCVQCARALVCLQPSSEESHRRLMSALVAAGDRAGALAAYESCKSIVLEEFGVLPDASTRALHVRILQSGKGIADRGQARSGAGLISERRPMLIGMEECLSAAMHCAVRGEAGIGKTHLIKQALGDRRATLIKLQSGGRDAPYAAMAQVLLEVHQRVAPRLEHPLAAELAPIAPSAFPHISFKEGVAMPARLSVAIQGWARAVAEAGVEVLALDDLHYADQQSQVIFSGLLQESIRPGKRLCLVLGYRSGELHGALSEAIEVARTQDRLRLFVLDRLSPAGIEELMQRLGHQDRIAHETLVGLHRRTGGNPLFLIELTRSWRGESRPGTTEGADCELSALIASRVRSSSEAACQLAYLAAIAGDDFSMELAENLTSVAPLDLMPAWQSLQERGIFDDAGLSHDLVTESVRGMVPLAIAQALHRRIADFLEDAGGNSERILHHRVLATQWELAYPLAVQLAGARRRSGIDEGPWQDTVLRIVEGMPQQSLPDCLWATAGLKLWTMPPDTMDRLSRLVGRVESLESSTEDTRAWLAYERARILHLRDGNALACYESLDRATRTLRMGDRARAWCNVWLCMAAVQVGRSATSHALQAHGAAQRLIDDVEDDYLRRVAAAVHRSFAMSTTEAAIETARRMRDARGARDSASLLDQRTELARVFNLVGFQKAAHRQFAKGLELLPPQAAKAWCLQHVMNMAPSAVVSGNYEAGIQWLQWWIESGTHSCGRAHPTLAWTWMTLGDFDRARHHAGAVSLQDLSKDFALCVLLSVVRSRLERIRGATGLAPLEDGLEALRSGGAGPVYVTRVELELAACTGTAEAQHAHAERLVSLLRPPNPHPGGLSYALLMLAEARRAIGHPDFSSAALEGASLVRRHRSATHHLPELLRRFARLLECSHPEKARALQHVARRWVISAMRNVPASARASFALLNADATDHVTVEDSVSALLVDRLKSS